MSEWVCGQETFVITDPNTFREFEEFDLWPRDLAEVTEEEELEEE